MTSRNFKQSQYRYDNLLPEDVFGPEEYDDDMDDLIDPEPEDEDDWDPYEGMR